jgi:flagellar basal body-associated protein FliL
MPENLENEFVDLVRQRNQKKKKLLVKRIIAVLLVAIASSVLGYWLFNQNVSFNRGNFLVSPTILGLDKRHQHQRKNQTLNNVRLRIMEEE